MRPKKYNFVPENQIKENVGSYEFSVTITAAMNIYITPFDADMFNLEGKTVRLYGDLEQKTIAWKEIKHGGILELENVRVLQKQSAGQIIISIGKLLKLMGVTKEMLPFKFVPVVEYKDPLVEEPFKVIDLKEFIKTANIYGTNQSRKTKKEYAVTDEATASGQEAVAQ